MHTRRLAWSILVTLLLTIGQPASLTGQRPASPAFVAPPHAEMKRVEAQNGVVTSANPLASEAGLAMLTSGGNAVDAAVATAFALAVVEPQMSGLGGSGAATLWNARERTPVYLDFYAAQFADRWRGTIESPERPAAGGAESSDTPAPPEPGDLRVVGIPGEVAGLLTLLETHGTKSGAEVLAPAIRLAEEGFPIGQILAGFIRGGLAKMKPFPAAMALYAPEGKPLAPGTLLRNPELAEALKRIAREGRKGFYEGPTAKAVVDTLNAGRHPATLDDLSSYEPQWKRPLCTDYRGFTILSAPPPQTGFQVLHTLELLEPFDLPRLGLPNRSAAAFDVLTSALRVGQAAARANSDPNWVAVPANGLSSSSFAATRRSLVASGAPAAMVEPVDAKGFDTSAPPPSCAAYQPYGPAPVVPGPTAPPWAAADAGDASDVETSGETTHLSVVDREGNAVGLTVTNSDVWGSGGFTNGFFLNNSGFRFTPENVDAPSRSRWRIRTTTIAPTVVLRNGSVEMVIGAPGGGRIPTEIAQVMVYTLDYGLDPLHAVTMPRIFPNARNTSVQVEHGFTPQLLKDIRAMGYDPVAESAGYARLYMIAKRNGAWIGVADPRHDGEPRGY